jgi:hypothetical protein
MDIPISWLTSGTPPQWGLFILGLIAFFRYVVLPWRQQNFDVDKELRIEVKDLRTEVKDFRQRLNHCEEQCEERDRKILGLQRQNVAQQIGFARVLMDKVGRDDPTISDMLHRLEREMMKLELQAAREDRDNGVQLGHPIKDTDEGHSS